MKMGRLPNKFFQRDVLQVAPELLGKILVRRFADGTEKRYAITEVEAYRGAEDLACHAAKGRTPRTEIMFAEGGRVYVYFIYGMYWLLNFVTSTAGNPQAVLIRGIEGFPGPGRVGRELQLDKSFYSENLGISTRLWIENAPAIVNYQISTRIGVNYAGDKWAGKPWRFLTQCTSKTKSNKHLHKKKN
ncbi:MAG: DNA-3-methyladenine glycosylase [Prolixibacteraceae bacterium]|jgi:DNA-3-methyladenine glycosylase|nr:DNA-3-methyladenine glycosylase [Prolixibacteraceae bacterium]